jgi:two-component sensor histidine kinase
LLATRHGSAATAIIPPDEPERLSAVRRYDILDTPPDGAFDRITAIAARRFNVPIAIVSIVDHDRIWFKSHHGLEVQQIDRQPGLCASAILSNEPWVLPDARKNPQSLANPLVAGDFGLRFYVGVPLRTHDGYNLGTLCVIDRKPRSVDPAGIEDLKDLASVVMDQMELRLSARRAVDHARMLAREIDHRVMNSLSFISALLAMQGRGAGHPDLASQLEIAAHRVGAVARVHRHLAVDEPGERINGLAYLRRLCADLASILQTRIEVQGTDAPVLTANIQPIGLIVNELVTNAAKHGAGRIVVSFAHTPEGGCALSVEDEGQGLPAGFEPQAPGNGLGMKLVVALASQLQGEVRAEPSPTTCGARFTVTFPLPEDGAGASLN